MAKKSVRKLSKLPKWAWWGLWLVGVLGSLLLVLYGVLQIWLSTWKTYTNNDFGFSFRYPPSWNVVGYIPSKADFDKGNFNHGDFIGVIFNVDPEKGVVTGNAYTPSSGDVEISLYKKYPNSQNMRPSPCVEISKTGVIESCINYSFPFITLHLETNIYVYQLFTLYKPTDINTFGYNPIFYYYYWIDNQIMNSFSLPK